MGVSGGIIGALIQGFKRAASTKRVLGHGHRPLWRRPKNPSLKGLVSLLEPFIDMVVICTMTALVIIIAMGQPEYNADTGLCRLGAAVPLTLMVGAA